MVPLAPVPQTLNGMLAEGAQDRLQWGTVGVVHLCMRRRRRWARVCGPAARGACSAVMRNFEYVNAAIESRISACGRVPGEETGLLPTVS